MSSDPDADERESDLVLDIREVNSICEFCGSVIEEQGQECPVLDQGRCAP